MENFQAVYGREYRDYTSSDRKSANLTINKLSQAALNTQMYPNSNNCSRTNTFNNYTSATYRQWCLPQNILPARTFTSRTTTCSSFGNIYTTTSWVIVPWQSSLLASTNIGHQQSWPSTSINERQLQSSTSHFNNLQRHYCYDEHYYCYEHCCYDKHCCMFLLVKIVHAYGHYCLVVEL